MNPLSYFICIALSIVGTIVSISTELSIGALIGITLPYLLIGFMIGINHNKAVQSRNK